MKNHSAPEKIRVEVDGKTYIGYRIVEGTRKLDQYIFYQGKCEKDLKGYPPDQKDTLMLWSAEQAISSAVRGRALSFRKIPARFAEIIGGLGE